MLHDLGAIKTLNEVTSKIIIIVIVPLIVSFSTDGCRVKCFGHGTGMRLLYRYYIP